VIGRLSGQLIEKRPPTIVVEVHGVGYEVDVPMSTFFQLPVTGAAVILHTHLIVREDAHLLFGFATERERQVFRQLLKISGVRRTTVRGSPRFPASAKRRPNGYCWSCATSSTPAWALPSPAATPRSGAMH